MTVCPNCETPVDDGLDVCPYCEEPLGSTDDVEARSTAPAVTVNVKSGHPEAAQAVDRLEVSVRIQRQKQTPVLRVIHGYGSSGIGGLIRETVRERLEWMVANGAIRAFIPGEDIRRTGHRKLPKSFEPLRSDVENPGITIVIL